MNPYRSILTDLWAIVRLRALYYWYFYVRRKPELFLPVIEQEQRELGL